MRSAMPQKCLSPVINATASRVKRAESLTQVIARPANLCDSARSTMKLNTLTVSLVAGVLLLAGCGKKEESASAGSGAANSANASAVATLEFTANDSMKFNLNRAEVKAGQEVKVILTNIGSMPKAAMGHNWVLLKKGADIQAFDKAAIGAAATDYVPASMQDQIIAHTKLLGPKQTDEITFKAPTEPGEYVFLCSFPAHYQAGMKGVFVVQ